MGKKRKKNRNEFVFLIGFVILGLIQLHSCGPACVGNLRDSIPRVHSVEDLQSDFRQFRKFLEESHPRMYQFTSRTEFDSLFEVHYRMIDHPMTTQEFYPVLVPLIARIGCGHTSLWAPDGYWERAPDNMFPFGVLARDGKLYIIHDYRQDLGISPKTEILSVNGREADDMVFEMTANIWSDGYIMSKRYRRLNQVFPFLYALNYGYPDSFRLVVSEEGRKRNITVDPLSRKIINTHMDSIYQNGIGSKSRLWMDVLDGQTALLTIRSFSYYDKVEKFHRFIDSSFQVIKNRNIQNLIIDLRGNDGGDPFCSTHLLRYIQKKPIVYFQQAYGRYSSFNKPLPMAANNFTGKQFYLIDGMCFSTTGHMTSLMKYHNLGTFVGEETGATYTCNDASHDVFLKYSGYRVQSARRTFAAAVYGFPLDQGILPDHPVQPTVDEVIRGRDAVLKYTLALIENLPISQP